MEILATGNAPAAPGVNTATPLLLTVTGDVFSSSKKLAEEIFGPASVLVQAASKSAMLQIANELSGHLTATIFATDQDLEEYRELVNILEQKVGRLLFNSFPTGVEVCSAMVHGGPYPSTTDSRSTSVGTAAIYRFTRPVCFQNMPQAILPAELKNENSLKISRLVNGERTDQNIN
jgi:NADP-dependent aldehyde dehydrogenase